MGIYGAALLLSLAAIAAPRPALRRAAVAAASLGLAAQVGLLAVRWNAAGFLPVTGLYSTLGFLAAWVVAIALYFVWRYGAASFLPAALGLALAALAGASKGNMALGSLTPALDTPLFALHVVTSFSAYGLFGVAALVGAYRLLGFSGSSLGMERRMLDESLYLGYILFTWCMLAGSLWAYLAWGSYWTWRMKGLWSTILWFYYSGLLHVRNRPGWQGWPLSALALLGFALVLFTFLALGLVFDSSHPLNS